MISLIWAQARGGVIGNAGSIPWRLPEDMAMFRALTIGSTVLMGRVTWDSLPPRFRPLAGRRNLVLTRRPDWAADGAIAVGSFQAALDQVEGPLWVIGGSQVYADALPFASSIVMTEVDADYDGDTFAPTVDDLWIVSSRDPAVGWSTSTAGLRYRVTRYAPADAAASGCPSGGISLSP
jgi:dihydrofolate reductase